MSIQQLLFLRMGVWCKMPKERYVVQSDSPCDGCNIANILSRYANRAMSHFRLLGDSSTGARHRHSLLPIIVQWLKRQAAIIDNNGAHFQNC